MAPRDEQPRSTLDEIAGVAGVVLLMAGAFVALHLA